MVIDYTKQEELINVLTFDKRINVIGCGALGSWLTFFLLKMGFKDIHAYDFDLVEEHNLPNQLFGEQHIGSAKTSAVEDMYTHMFKEDDRTRLTIHNLKIDDTNAMSLKGVVFSCVDTMKARAEIYENCYKCGNAELWIEGRLSLFGAYVYTLDKKNQELFNNYQKTLYKDEESELSVCGISQTALPSAVNAATTMLMQMISWFRGNDVIHEIRYQMPEYTSLNAVW